MRLTFKSVDAKWWRLLRVPWTARRSNQSNLREISPEYSLEGLMLKLKLQFFGRLMRRTDSHEKTLMLGKIEGRRRRGWQRMRWLDGITGSWSKSSWSWWWTGRPGMPWSLGSQRVGHDWAIELNWTGKGDRQNALYVGAWETAPLLSAFTWIPHLLSLHSLSLPLLNLPPLCSFRG